MRICALLALCSAAAANAASVTFDINTNTGSAPVLYSIVVDDNTPALLTFAVAVAGTSPNNADIVGLYFDFGAAGANAGYTLADFSGAAISRFAANTSNVQGGNIGQTFQFGLGIGTPGAGSDFYDTFTFTMALKNGLGLDDLESFGVRGMSVGEDATFGNPGEESSKTFVERNDELTPVPVPLPTGAGLAGLGMLVLGARRRRSL